MQLLKIRKKLSFSEKEQNFLFLSFCRGFIHGKTRSFFLMHLSFKNVLKTRYLICVNVNIRFWVASLYLLEKPHCQSSGAHNFGDSFWTPSGPLWQRTCKLECVCSSICLELYCKLQICYFWCLKQYKGSVWGRAWLRDF